MVEKVTCRFCQEEEGTAERILWYCAGLCRTRYLGYQISLDISRLSTLGLNHRQNTIYQTIGRNGRA